MQHHSQRHIDENMIQDCIRYSFTTPGDINSENTILKEDKLVELA